jgi:hypothetical protein
MDGTTTSVSKASKQIEDPQPKDGGVGVGHDLRRAVYGPPDALCTTCVVCGALWWCPVPPPGGRGLVPEVCPGSKGRVPPIIAAGMAWVEGVPDEVVDAVNARLIEVGMGVKVADFRALAAKHGRDLPRTILEGG